MVQCSYDGLTRRLAWFSWEKPADSGGFPVTDYDVSLFINGKFQLVHWKQGNPLKLHNAVNDGDTLKFSVSAVNILGRSRACLLDVTVPTSKITAHLHRQNILCFRRMHTTTYFV